MKKNINNINEIKDQVTFTPSPKAKERLLELMEARGFYQSQAINKCIEEIKIINIGGASNVGKTFCSIKDAIENNKVNPKLMKVGRRLCQCIEDLIAKEKM